MAASLVKFFLTQDANHNIEGGVIVPSRQIDNYVLTGGAAATAATVPTGARVAVFSSTGNFYADFVGGTAATPAVDVTNGTGSELNPVARDVTGITAISLQAPANCVVVIAYFK